MPACGATELATVDPSLSAPLATIAAAEAPAFQHDSAALGAQQASVAPSLVASPLPSEATADLTAAVTQQMMTAALTPAPAAPSETAAQEPLQQQPQAQQEPQTLQVQQLQEQQQQLSQQLLLQEQAMVEGIKAVVSEGIQGANLVESTMPAVG